MKIKPKTLTISVLIPILVGGAAALLTHGGIADFDLLEKSPLTPPGYVFPIVWTALYILMGVASYLVAVSGKDVKMPLAVYALSLAVNFLWPIVFFNKSAYLFAFLLIVVLWALVLLTAVAFYSVSPAAGYLMIPYLLWVTFAAYLNFSVYLLN